MPIYEYVCRACAAEFEELAGADEAVPCPRCGAARAAKKLSSFATARAGGSPARERAGAPPAPPGGCGTCGDPRGPGSCAS